MTAGTHAFAAPLQSPPKGAGNPESQYAFWMMKARPGWTMLNRGVNGERAEATEADLLWMYRRTKALGIVPVAATVLPFTRATPAQSAG